MFSNLENENLKDFVEKLLYKSSLKIINKKLVDKLNSNFDSYFSSFNLII